MKTKEQLELWVLNMLDQDTLKIKGNDKVFVIGDNDNVKIFDVRNINYIGYEFDEVSRIITAADVAAIDCSSIDFDQDVIVEHIANELLKMKTHPNGRLMN